MDTTETALTEQVATTPEPETASPPDQQAASTEAPAGAAEQSAPEAKDAASAETEAKPPEKPKTTSEILREAAFEAVGLGNSKSAEAAPSIAQLDAKVAPEQKAGDQQPAPQVLPIPEDRRELIKKYAGGDGPESVVRAASEYVQYKERLEQNGLTDDDVRFAEGIAVARKNFGLNDEALTYGLEFGRLIQFGSPREVIAGLTPLLQEMGRQAGEILPDDLKKQVEAGVMSEDGAKEVARARAEAEWFQQRQHQETLQWQQQEIARGREEWTSAAEAWASSKSKTVPGFADNKNNVAENAKAMFLGMYHDLPNDKKPRTSAQVTALLDKALDRVLSVAPTQPPPPPKVPAQPGRIVTTPKQPQTLAEVAARAVGLI